MYISDEYKKLNEELHARNPKFGTVGKKFVGEVMHICKALDTTDVLDYGCGKSTLSQNMPFEIQEYDPAIEKFSELPKPADIVVCTDVLEHIEPEYIDSVVQHLKELTKKCLFLVVGCGPAKKTLDDGRNAHLIQEDELWWLKKFLPDMKLVNFVLKDDSKSEVDKKFEEYIIILQPLC